MQETADQAHGKAGELSEQAQDTAMDLTQRGQVQLGQHPRHVTRHIEAMQLQTCASTSASANAFPLGYALQEGAKSAGKQAGDAAESGAKTAADKTEEAGQVGSLIWEGASAASCSGPQSCGHAYLPRRRKGATCSSCLAKSCKDIECLPVEQVTRWGFYLCHRLQQMLLRRGSSTSSQQDSVLDRQPRMLLTAQPARPSRS